MVTKERLVDARFDDVSSFFETDDNLDGDEPSSDECDSEPDSNVQTNQHQEGGQERTLPTIIKLMTGSLLVISVILHCIMT